MPFNKYNFLLIDFNSFVIRHCSRMDPKTRLEEKRNVPNWVQKLLSYDVELTKRFVSFSLNFVPVRSIKTHCLFLEVSYFAIHIFQRPNFNLSSFGDICFSIHVMEPFGFLWCSLRAGFSTNQSITRHK